VHTALEYYAPGSLFRSVERRIVWEAEEQAMSITKRRMEAAEEDVNRELRLCIGCGERIGGKGSA
jgi:hypothetical protein